MTLGILSDIHGNLEALEAVLASLAARGVRTLACLGDFVGYGASPNECIGRLKPHIEVAVGGNHDLAACGRIRLGYFNPDAADAARWTTDALTPEHLAFLQALPMTVEWRGLRLVHASPASPEDWHYVFSPADALHEMAAVTESVCVIGHSHFPGTFEIGAGQATYTRDDKVTGRAGQRYLINAPSVGQPRDGDHRAGYLLVETEPWAFEHVRIEYDIEGAMRRIRDAGLPAFLANRLLWGE